MLERTRARWLSHSRTMNDYIAAEWQRILTFNGLRSFDDFWLREVEWFERPNDGRGGWSGVARCELKLPEGGTIGVFLKRQENHNTRTFAHPLRGVPTFLREFRNILRYQKFAIPTLTPVYFGWRHEGGYDRAILITEELAGFKSLDHLSRDWLAGPVPRQTRLAAVRATAMLLRKIHAHRLRHNCFYPKHVFLRVKSPAEVEARVIDLEKTKWRPLPWDRDFRDLRTLNHRAVGWSRVERVAFFKEYLGIRRLTPAAKNQWRQISRRHFQRHPEDQRAGNSK